MQNDNVFFDNTFIIKIYKIRKTLLDVKDIII